ncbi:hypothetical protein O3M35_011357 [Rhynocoris fuscipes]|uniref:Uncharacterized protein n=1 Tax=Rhynocoris fuscipes TaxID=488301 RepID=A0AAW1CVG9_9HEMI
MLDKSDLPLLHENKDSVDSETVEKEQKNGEAEKEKQISEIKVEETDVEQSSAEEANKEVKKEVSEECSYDPECHLRMKLLKDYLDNACKQLNGYIKIKKSDVGNT